MKNKDIIMLEELYELVVEDAQSTFNQAMNMLIHNKVGNEIFKYKNKPENKEKITRARNENLSVVEKFANIVKQNNPNDKNLSDVIPLVKFFIKNSNFSNSAIERLGDFYQQYMQYPSLVNQRYIFKANSLTEFTGKIHEEESKKNRSERSATLGGGEDANKVYEDDEVIVFRATDPESVENSIDNCKKYGKGSNLCISSGSDSNIKHHYLDYRLNHKLTTYFVWVKEKEGYLLVDAQDNGKFGWNDNPMGGYNHDNTNETKQEIINKFPYLKGAFDNNAFKSLDIGHEEYKHKIEEFEKELQDIEDSYKDELKNCSVHFDVNHDEGDYIYYYASGAIKIEGIDLIKPIDTEDSYEFAKIKNYDSGDSIPHRYKDDPKEFHSMVKLINDFRRYNSARNSSAMVDQMTGIYEGKDGTIYLNFDIAGDDGGSSTNINDFDYLCQAMAGYEKDYNQIKKAFIHALMVNGFLEQHDQFKQIENEEEFINGLKSFIYDEEDPEIFEIRKKLFLITNEENEKLVDSEGFFKGNDIKDNSEWMGKRIYWFIKKNYKEENSNGEQLKFKDFMESYYYEEPKLNDYSISGIRLEYERFKKDDGYVISGKLEVKIEYLTDKAAKILKFLDDSGEDLINFMYYQFARICDKKDEKTENIKKIYARYL